MSNNIRKLRRSLDLSQEELAKKAGISRVYISNLERGEQNPSINLSLRLAKALGVTAEQLFYTQSVNHDVQSKKEAKA